MRPWDPRALWNEVRRTLRDWMHDEERDDVEDPTLLFHLAFTAPLLIGVLVMIMRRG